MSVGEDLRLGGGRFAGPRQRRVVGRGALQHFLGRRHAGDFFGRGADDDDRIADRAVLCANDTATPSAGQSSAVRDVTFM